MASGSRVVVPFPGSVLHKYIVATDPLDGEVHDVNLGAVCLYFLEVYFDEGPVPLIKLGMASTVWNYWVKDALRNILIGELNQSLGLDLPMLFRYGSITLQFPLIDQLSFDRVPIVRAVQPYDDDRIWADGTFWTHDPEQDALYNSLVDRVSQSIECDLLEIADAESTRLRSRSRSRSPVVCRDRSQTPSPTFPPGHWGNPGGPGFVAVRYECDFL